MECNPYKHWILGTNGVNITLKFTIVPMVDRVKNVYLSNQEKKVHEKL